MNVTVNDTIVCDTARLNSFINSGQYDYNSEIGETETSLFEKVMNLFYSWLDDLFGGIDDLKDAVFNGEKGMLYVWIGLGILLVLALLYFLYKKKMFFFKKKDKKEDDYAVVEDTIYGIDFEKDIDIALRSNNYREAIRLRYLQCLKLLSDNGAIDWRIFKTPLQYTREFKNSDFITLTRQYVLVRFGGYEAVKATFDDVSAKLDLVRKQVDNFSISSEKEGGAHEA